MKAWPCIAGVLLLAGCDEKTPPPPSPQVVVQPKAAVVLRQDSNVGVALQTDPVGQQQIHQVQALQVAVNVQNAPASNNLVVELVTPSGAIYQRMQGAIADSSAAPQTHLFQMPVAGTFIETYSMSGTWVARVFLNGQERTDQTFELTP